MDTRIVRTEDFLPSQIDYLIEHGVTTDSVKEKVLVKMLKEKYNNIFKANSPKAFRLINANIASDNAYLVMHKVLMPMISMKLVDVIENLRILLGESKKLDPDSKEITAMIDRLNENLDSFLNLSLKIVTADIIDHVGSGYDVKLMASENPDSGLINIISHKIITETFLYRYADNENHIKIEDIDTAVKNGIITSDEYSNRLENALKRYDGMVLKSSGKSIEQNSKYFPNVVAFIMKTDCKLSALTGANEDHDTSFTDIIIVGIEPNDLEVKAKMSFLFK